MHSTHQLPIRPPDARVRRVLRTAATLAALVVLAASCLGCNNRSTEPRTVRGTPTFGSPDLDFRDAGSVLDEPLGSLCAPGARTCLFENSPLYQQCAPDGQSFERRSCAPSEMCRERRCVEFACVPDRDLCVSTDARGTCAPNGRAVRDVESCPEGTVCRAGACLDPCEEARRSRSYIGCRYIARELENIYRGQSGPTSDSPFALVIANPSELLEASIDVTDAQTGASIALIESLDLGAGSTRTTVRSELIGGVEARTLAGPATDIAIPPRSAAVLLIDRQDARRSTLQIDSTHPVIAYQFSPYCCNFTYSNDASLLYPTDVLQNEYRILTYPSWQHGEGASLPGYAYVVGLHDGTRVEVEAPVPVGIGDAPSNTGASAREHSFTLDRGAIKVIATAGDVDTENQPRLRDPSGTRVLADRPVQVFVGHPCTFVPQDKWACDHLEEQLPSIDTLGQNYLLMPTRSRQVGTIVESQEAVYWRIVAHEDASIDVEPALEEVEIMAPSNDATEDCRDRVVDGAIELAAGEVCEIGTRAPLSLASDATIVVGGVISGHQSTGVDFFGTQAGDPALFLLPPVEQFRTDYSFVTPPTFAKTYVAVAIPEGSALALDGRSIAEESRLERRSVTLEGDSWEVFSVALEPGLHRLESPRKFGIVAYAYDDYVSYAFTGGMNLVPRKQATSR